MVIHLTVVFLLLLLLFDRAEATADGRRTKRTDEEGAGHLPAVLSDQPVHRHPAAHLRRAQALRAEGSNQPTRMFHLTSPRHSHCCAPIRPQFPSAFFQGKADLCGCLCHEILKCCNHRSSSTQTEAAALLYFFMRKNFEFTKGKSIVRSHLQVSGRTAERR